MCSDAALARLPAAAAPGAGPHPGVFAAGAAEPMIRVAGLGKCYEIYARPLDRLKQTLWRGRRQFYREFWALRGVSFEVQRGEAVGIIGRNGSGKSTLLQIIAGTLRPTEGRVEVRARVHALLELGSGFNHEFTGRENVYLNGALLGLTRQQVAERFDDIAAFADIGDFLDQPIKTYSTGMVVRLAFAVQAQLQPEVLVVDEALAVGDEKFQRKCFARMDELQAGGTAILLVTHSTNMVEKYCQRALLLERGTLHGLGPSRQIIDQYHALLYADEQAYLRVLNQSLAAAAEPEALPASQPPELAAPVVPPPASPAAEFAGADRASAQITSARAQIARVWILDAGGAPRELFECGEPVEIGFELKALEDLPAVQAGLRLRTVEGVEAFGTSTAYFGNSPGPVRAGARCLVRFRFAAHLCAGTYFVSLAAAEPTGGTDMQYLDKRSDVLVLRIHEYPPTGTGIAQLHAQVSATIVPP